MRSHEPHHSNPEVCCVKYSDLYGLACLFVLNECEKKQPIAK